VLSVGEEAGVKLSPLLGKGVAGARVWLGLKLRSFVHLSKALFHFQICRMASAQLLYCQKLILATK
jgi:hypothetical protein